MTTPVCLTEKHAGLQTCSEFPRCQISSPLKHVVNQKTEPIFSFGPGSTPWAQSKKHSRLRLFTVPFAHSAPSLASSLLRHGEGRRHGGHRLSREAPAAAAPARDDQLAGPWTSAGGRGRDQGNTAEQWVQSDYPGCALV